MNEASDRVSDAEAARPMLGMYHGERYEDERGKTCTEKSKKSMPGLLQVRPQVRQGCPQAQLGSTVEERARICNAQAVAISRRDEGGGHEWRCVGESSADGAEDESTDADESCCIGGHRHRVVPPSGVDAVADVVRKAAADEPQLGKFPYHWGQWAI
ncbi:hypothetical protein FB451DRAFT_1533639 [Mycena latifolia]|nr:hypothetical protein FB451DRAFT_1533639 [Mycena latifolia]